MVRKLLDDYRALCESEGCTTVTTALVLGIREHLLHNDVGDPDETIKSILDVGFVSLDYPAEPDPVLCDSCECELSEMD